MLLHAPRRTERSGDTLQVTKRRGDSTLKGRSDTLKILDRQRIRGGLHELKQSDDESADETTTYVETANGEDMARELRDEVVVEVQTPLRRQVCGTTYFWLFL